MTDFWDPPTKSEAFTAKYDGWCHYLECHKHNEVEQGDCCEYLDGKLMHLRCKRAELRARQA